MLPLCDIIPTRTPPLVTIALVALNVIAFSVLDGVPPTGLVPLLLPGGLIPLLVNALYLWLFGGAVEDRLGHGRFLVLYLAAAVIAAIAQSYVTALPLLGAGASVSGVLGAYFAMYARSRVLVLIPFPPLVAEVPVAIFLAFWFLFQMLLAIGTVAFVGPASGFLSGMLLSFVLRRPERSRVEWWAP